VWVGEGCVVLCWFDPAIVAPRLAWLVEGVAFGGADGDVGWQFHGQVTLYTYKRFEHRTRTDNFLLYFISLYIYPSRLSFPDILSIPG
jgi:hypothetical protein